MIRDEEVPVRRGSTRSSPVIESTEDPHKRTSTKLLVSTAYQTPSTAATSPHIMWTSGRANQQRIPDNRYLHLGQSETRQRGQCVRHTSTRTDDAAWSMYHSVPGAHIKRGRAKLSSNENSERTVTRIRHQCSSCITKRPSTIPVKMITVTNIKLIPKQYIRIKLRIVRIFINSKTIIVGMCPLVPWCQRWRFHFSELRLTDPEVSHVAQARCSGRQGSCNPGRDIKVTPPGQAAFHLHQSGPG